MSAILSSLQRPIPLGASHIQSALEPSSHWGGSPPSSSSSDAGETSEDSNSSVGSVEVEVKLSDTLDCPTTTSFVGISDIDLSADLLKAVFDKHAEGGRLGLHISNLPSGDVDRPQWKHQSWKGANTEQRVRYLVSSVAEHITVDNVGEHTQQADHLLTFSLASLRSVISFLSSNGILYILERPSVVFLPLSHTPSFNPFSINTTTISPSSSLPIRKIGHGNIPTPEEWRTLWRAWDLVTLEMIPQEMLHQKPIDLRHKCLFYIGHIPTFLDMLLSKAIGGSPTEPKYFWNIFERGIDPHVDDPDHCHNHSEVPEADEDWPTLETIMGFRDNVRARLMRLYDDLNSGKRVLTRNIARTLVMTLEHEGFHVETLLYMLIQRAGTGTLPPPGFTSPPWASLSRQWNQIPRPSTPTVTLGPTTITLGQEDSEGDDFLEDVQNQIDGHQFGWDNESPSRQVEVGAFKAEWRPVSNGEFERFWRGDGKDLVGLPKSWVEEDGAIHVKTMYGPVPMEHAQHWPVLTSYDDLAIYAHAKGGRLPTEPELRLFLDTYDDGYEGGANSGFRNWHPVPATTGLPEHEGKGSNGGVWEWTSTVFDTHPGLVPTKLFTGYSADFFDTKHQVALGASYATIPRLGRRTIRNFYQHNYPYPWIGARVVYDI